MKVEIVDIEVKIEGIASNCKVSLNDIDKKVKRIYKENNKWYVEFEEDNYVKNKR